MNAGSAISTSYVPDRFWDMSPISSSPSRRAPRTLRQRISDALYPVARLVYA